MMNMRLDRINRPVARQLWSAGAMAVAAASPAGCGHDAAPGSIGTAQAETPRDFEFALVHAEEKTPDGRRALRLDSLRGTLEIEYLDRAGVTRKALVKVGMHPVSVRVSSNHEAWVVDPIADSISIVDLESASVIATLQTAPEPTDVLFAGSPARAYVTVAQGRELIVLDSIAPTEPLARIALQFTPL